jgi:hypothetical protein
VDFDLFSQNDDSLFSTHRIEDPHGCFALPLNKWGVLQVGVGRCRCNRIFSSHRRPGRGPRLRQFIRRL